MTNVRIETRLVNRLPLLHKPNKLLVSLYFCIILNTLTKVEMNKISMMLYQSEDIHQQKLFLSFFGQLVKKLQCNNVKRLQKDCYDWCTTTIGITRPSKLGNELRPQIVC